MNNHFESSNNDVASILGQTQEVKDYVSNLESKTEQLELSSMSVEEFLKTLDSRLETDAHTFNIINDQYVLEEKQYLNLNEPNLELESKIKSIKEKYNTQREAFEMLVLPKIKSIGKRIAQGAIGAVTLVGAIAHLEKQELPEYLSKDTNPKEIEWNDDTKKELGKLSYEYALLMKQDSVYKDKEVPREVFENRFMDFVREYAPEIQIIHPDDQKGLGNHLYEWTFRNVFGSSKNRAHYVRDVLFYQEQNIKWSADKSKYIDTTSSLIDFKAEVSHHLNGDWSLDREAAFVDDFISNYFQQRKMYRDVYTNEFQAHEVAEKAVNRYLAIKDRNFEVEFVDVYNIYQDYYREFIKMKEYGSSGDIEMLLYLYLNDDDWSFIQLKENKEIVFENLKEAKRLIDLLPEDISSTVKQSLFRDLTHKVALNKQNPNFKDALSGTSLEDAYVQYLFTKESENPATTHYYEAVNKQEAEAIKEDIEDYKKVIKNKKEHS